MSSVWGFMSISQSFSCICQQVEPCSETSQVLSTLLAKKNPYATSTFSPFYLYGLQYLRLYRLCKTARLEKVLRRNQLCTKSNMPCLKYSNPLLLCLKQLSYWKVCFIGVMVIDTVIQVVVILTVMIDDYKWTKKWWLPKWRYAVWKIKKNKKKKKKKRAEKKKTPLPLL